jgi:uncharacterized damage-inducible protein DinB
MTTKQEWLERLAHTRQELLASIDGLSATGWATGEMLPGWTVQDTLAHIAAWETRVATLLPDLLSDNGMRVVGAEVETFNAEQVALRRARTPRELLDELADSRRRILEALANVTDDDLTRPRSVPWGQLSVERWALQEICDHDGEHAAQLRAWRAAHASRESGRSLWDARVDGMAAERAGLLFACLGLDANTLASTPVAGEWTIKDVLAHVAAWDDFHAARAELALAGREAEIVSVEVDERNAKLLAERRNWPLDQALKAAIESRQRYLELFSSVGDEQLVRPVHLPWMETSVWHWAYWRARHDAAHAADIRAWRGARSVFSPGPRCVLLAAMEAARDDLLRQIDRIPAGERETRLVMGHWKLKDVLGHIADWDLFALKALLLMERFRPLPFVPESEADAINAQQMAARRRQTWEQAWADLHHVRADLISVLDNWDDARLAIQVDYPADWGRTAYGWVVGQTVYHDREHADALRALLL